MSKRYPHLFAPLQIGGLTLKNRILQTAHDKHYSWGGAYTQRDVDYQVERARGGVALVVTGNRAVHPTSASARSTLGYGAATSAGDRLVVDAVHRHGAAIFAQLGHTGANAADNANDDLRANWGPSTFASPINGNGVMAMDVEDIATIVESFATSARVAQTSGFDGVEVHFAHSYLVHQFLSPLYNRRRDDYGGSPENRLRFPSQVVARVRDQLGPGYVLGVRLALSDFVPGGVEVDDAIEIGRALRDAADVDYFSVSTGGGDKRYMVATSDVADGWLLSKAGAFKSAFPDVPVFVVGGVKEPALAEEALASGMADMVAMTRAQIADPQLVSKILSGREDEINHCIRGNQGCIAGAFTKGQPVSCTVNPAAGREGKFGLEKIRRADAPARWLVVGGGPAGMKAAETLARRGHSVSLLEREPHLGGQVSLITQTPGRQEFGWITRDLGTQLNRLGVDVQLGIEATVDTVAAHSADGVIIATGARPDGTGFSFAGAPFPSLIVEAEHVNVITAWDVLKATQPIGPRVVLFDDDGSRMAAGTAEVLLDRGHDVELVTRFTSLFPGTAATLDLPFLYERLFSKGLRYRVNCWGRRIDSTGIVLFNLYSDNLDATLQADTVVLATMPQPDEILYLELKKTLPRVVRVGDCVAPRKLDHAIYEGFLAGLERSGEYLREGELEGLT
jgi:2,4-dienoyl-CoA reductase-like NADH-dependent reductase (Old Yellow Enzyme family)